MDDFLLEKYSRQILFEGIGLGGQQRLLASSAVVAGCGAIGAAAANLLVRAGVGRIRIVDRDFVEPSNLQRQTLFDESDAREALPKAVAAERKLRAINSGISVEGLVADINPGNVAELLNNFDLILDGTDNFETRFLINDFAVKSGKPWIYAAAVASYGLTMTVQPGKSACLACLLEGADAVIGMEDTCDTIGVVGPIVNLIASLQVAEAMKLLSGNQEALHGRLISSDVWTGHFQSVKVERSPRLPVLRPAQFFLPRRPGATTHHHVWPRLRADTRTQSRARSCHLATTAVAYRHWHATQRFSSAVSRRTVRDDRIFRWARHREGHDRSCWSRVRSTRVTLARKHSISPICPFIKLAALKYNIQCKRRFNPRILDSLKL